MREIKFKAWNSFHREWFYFKVGEGFQGLMIDPKTICEWTGKYDSNGKEAHQSDITIIECLDGQRIKCVIVWNDKKAQWLMEPTPEAQGWGYVLPGWDLDRPFEVIGNIHFAP